MGRLYFRLSLTRESKALKPYATEFHGATLEAQIVELYSNAVSIFLTTLGRPYFIDPVLYKFTSPFFGEIREKRWREPLSERYAIDRPLATKPDGFLPADFNTMKDVDAVVKAILEYQRGRIPNSAAGLEVLAELLGQEESLAGPPEFLVAPYLYRGERATLAANLRLASVAAGQKRAGERLYAEIALDREYLDSQTDLDSIAREYAKIPLDGYLLWISDFREWEEDSTVLIAFAKFVLALSAASKGREVINLFGSYYSTLLAAQGILGASVQGVGISEYRDPTLTGGGGYLRYYVPISRQSVGVDLADDLLEADPKLFACACSNCSGGIRPSKMSVLELAKHFVEVRIAEHREASDKSADEIASGLNRDAKALAAVKVPGVAGLTASHYKRLEVWEKAVKGLDGTKKAPK
jgi:hypothetical protein